LGFDLVIVARDSQGKMTSDGVYRGTVSDPPGGAERNPIRDPEPDPESKDYLAQTDV